MQGGSQNPITVFQLKIDVAAYYLFEKKKGKNQQQNRTLPSLEIKGKLNFFVSQWQLKHWQVYGFTWIK